MPENKFKKSNISVIIVVYATVFSVIGYFFITSEFYNKRFNAQNYWTQQAIGLKRLIKYKEASLLNTKFELQQKQDNLDLKIHHEYLILQALEIDSKMALNLATKFARSEIDSVLKQINFLSKNLNNDKILLQKAEGQLSKINNKN